MKTAKTWTPTKQHGLYRHISGGYYAVVSIAGKRTWRTLKTTVLEIAKTEHDKLKEDVGVKNELAKQGPLQEHMTGADAIAIREHQIAHDPRMKASTRKYWGQIIAALKLSWPELLTTEMRKISAEQCLEWAGKGVKELSSTRYNNSIGMIKSLFVIALEKGARRTNPASKLKRVKQKVKDLSGSLPNRAKFAKWVKSIREGGGRFSAACADFVEFLAYTGMRKGEAGWVTWRDCDFTKGEIFVKGDPEDGTKNSESRRVPMIAAARTLLERMKDAQKVLELNAPVLKVREAQKAMDKAAEKVGMERLTHHDLRHFFATICIESAVDIPTVSRWLGHKDGGALAMKVYGHLRNEHSLAAATRVSFAA